MPRFSANLVFMFTDLPFMDRFAAASKAGFKAVEFMFPYPYAPAEVKKALTANKLELDLFNLPAGDWDGGERGIAVLADKEGQFTDSVAKALEYAKALGTTKVNCLVGKAVDDDAAVMARLVKRLTYAADQFAGHGVKLLLEAVNSYDMPGFWLTKSAQAFELIAKIGRPNVYFQYDIYHMQRMEGELMRTIRDNFARIAHFQLADNPNRNQPGTGEINYPYLFKEIDALGYAGYIGLEYKPAPDTLGSLGWIRQYGYSL